MSYLPTIAVWFLEALFCLGIALAAFNLKFRRICFGIGAGELSYYRYSTLLGGIVSIDRVRQARRKYLLFSLGALVLPALALALPPLQRLWTAILPHMLTTVLNDTAPLSPLRFLNYVVAVQAAELLLVHLPTLILYPEEIERENVVKAARPGGTSLPGRVLGLQRHYLKMRMVEIFTFPGETTRKQELFQLGMTGNAVAGTLAETILKAKRDIAEDEIERLYAMVMQLQKTGIGFREPEPGEIADALTHRRADEPVGAEALAAHRLGRKLLRIINTLGVPYVLDALGYGWRGRNRPSNAVALFRTEAGDEFRTRLIDIRKSDERGWFVDSLKAENGEYGVREGQTLDLLEIDDENLRHFHLRFNVCRVGEEMPAGTGGLSRRFFAGRVAASPPRVMKALHKAVGA